ncbi:MAG TPA: PHP domain-containing protein [Candidatus Saccharimonadales bacterium]|nr:PHP domain-containing protein [Candidatus Saccharimonadales bacterium]
MYKLDLHTHSHASPDGSLRARDYALMLASGQLDCIAVTDHNRIDFALGLQAELGDRIIVGEEVSTREGEIIGLFLKEVVPAGLSALETAKRIRAQGGLVYIPHPFETVRSGISEATLLALSLVKLVDIIETYNGRTLQNRGDRAKRWAQAHATAKASSSDAHGHRGWGKTWTVVAKQPTARTLVKLLARASHSTKSTGLVGRLYPKLNRLRKVGKHA